MKLVSWICLVSMACLQLSSVSRAAASASSGEGGSITIETLDPVTRKPIPDGLLRPGMEVILEVHAFDASGKSIPCKPSFVRENGISGNQIETVVTQDDGTGLMKMGDGFGSAEVKVQCDSLPDVTAKLPVVNNTLKTPAEKEAAASDKAAASEAAGDGGKVALGILGGVAIAAGVTALVIGLSSSATTTCSHPSLWCRSSDTCCPEGYPYYCTGPSNRAGCYADVFISGCNEKVFCTSEY